MIIIQKNTANFIHIIPMLGFFLSVWLLLLLLLLLLASEWSVEEPKNNLLAVRQTPPSFT